MNRSTLDKLISSVGLIVAVVLLASSCILFYAHNFIHKQVHDELAAQAIVFPPKNSASLAKLPTADRTAMEKYAGQQMTTGAQAQTFADHFIAVHLREAAGGKTYSQLSTAAIANPSNTQLAAQANTAFKGETLRGLLLNAYAFDTMAVVANCAAWGAVAAGIVLLILAMMGFMHAGIAAKTKSARKR